VSTALDLATDCASAWRITHLVTADAFPPVAALRDKVMDFFGPDSSITYLVTCARCAGVWVSAGVALVEWRRGRVDGFWGWALRTFAIAGVQMVIATSFEHLEADLP
jgi:hypothetical protein